VFEVLITRDEQGHVESIAFGDADFNCARREGNILVWMDTEEGMDWERLKAAVLAEAAIDDQEEAALTGDANTPWQDEDSPSAKMRRIWATKDDEDCPVCGGPLPCVKCLADLRCDS
jgi:hypothetical protein